jgi:hypothetical protein
MVLFLGTVCNPDVRGRPLRTVEAVPARRERADCRRAISASMAERMSCVSIPVRYQSVRQSNLHNRQSRPDFDEITNKLLLTATFALLWRSHTNNAEVLGSHEHMGWKRIEVGELIAIAFAVRVRFVIVLLEPQKSINTTARQ